ncbi:unnamed protein product, partial [Rotaria sp. Silwood1]
MYTHDSVLRHKIEQTIIITIFDYILHFNHRTMINEQLRKLFNGFKPLAVYKAQLLIEKELIVIKLLLNIRKQQALLTIDDLNRYLESYPIPCRFLVKQHKFLIETNQELLIIDKNINNELLPNLRSLRHNYIQTKIPRNQLHLLVEQGCGCGCSLDLIRHITYNISLLIKENGSIAEKPLMKYFQQYQILFHADFQLLLIRYDMIALEDLMVLLIVSKLAKPNEIKSYAKTIFCLN